MYWSRLFVWAESVGGASGDNASPAPNGDDTLANKVNAIGGGTLVNNMSVSAHPSGRLFILIYLYGTFPPF